MNSIFSLQIGRSYNFILNPQSRNSLRLFLAELPLFQVSPFAFSFCHFYEGEYYKACDYFRKVFHGLILIFFALLEQLLLHNSIKDEA